MNLLVDVTQDDLDAGARVGPRCPVELALRRLFGGSLHCFVHKTFAQLPIGRHFALVNVELPAVAAVWIHRWDHFDPVVGPFSFALSVPPRDSSPPPASSSG